MPHPTYFVQGCPTCGRRLHIRVEHLGKRVVCQHCRGQFTACDPAARRCGDDRPAQTLLHRAGRLLEQAAEAQKPQRHTRPK